MRLGPTQTPLRPPAAPLRGTSGRRSGRQWIALVMVVAAVSGPRDGFGQPAPESAGGSGTATATTAQASSSTSTAGADTPSRQDPAEAKRLAEEAARLERLQAEQDALSDDSGETSLWPTFVRTVIMLTAVSLLAYLLLGKLLPRLMRIEPPTAPRRLLKVVDRLAIDQKRSIMVLKLGDEYYLVGAAEQNISMMSKLDSDRVERLLAETEIPSPGFSRLNDLFRRKAKGN